MSRSALGLAVNLSAFLHLAAICALLVWPSGLAAQQQPATNANDVLANARSAYGPPPPEKKCEDQQNSDEIVVCAEEQEQSQFRIRSDENAQDDYARETMFQNDPQAPDVAGPGIFRGKATASGCLKGVNCPPPPALIIDFSQLPEAPPGSDADRISRGLPPLGDDGPRTDNGTPQ